MVVYLHNEFLYPFIIRGFGEHGVGFVVLQALFILIDEIEKLLVVSAVRLLELTGADLQEEIAVVFAVGVDLTFFKNIKAHEVKPDQVHGMLIQMQIILFAVALSELGVLADDRAEI